jgi:CSLREA domain-containing protein
MSTRKLFIAFILGLGLTLALVWLLDGGSLPVARAASIGVTTTDDGVAADGNCTLREAIIAANTDTAIDACVAGDGADVITLTAGAYVLTVTGAGENAALTGDLDITSTLVIVGAGPDQTIIDANGIDRVFDIRPSAGTVVISGVTLINGNVTGNGGGIYNEDAALTLINTAVSSNTANQGGGVYVYSGQATLSGGQVVSNTVNDSHRHGDRHRRQPGRPGGE